MAAARERWRAASFHFSPPLSSRVTGAPSHRLQFRSESKDTEYMIINHAFLISSSGCLWSALSVEPWFREDSFALSDSNRRFVELLVCLFEYSSILSVFCFWKLAVSVRNRRRGSCAMKCASERLLIYYYHYYYYYYYYFVFVGFNQVSIDQPVKVMNIYSLRSKAILLSQLSAPLNQYLKAGGIGCQRVATWILREMKKKNE